MHLHVQDEITAWESTCAHMSILASTHSQYMGRGWGGGIPGGIPPLACSPGSSALLKVLFEHGY